MIKISESLFDKKIILYSANCSTSRKNNLSSTKKRLHSKGSFVSDSSIIRAKSKLIDYAKNNIFNYMITITFDDKKYNLNNIFLARQKITKFFTNYKNRYDPTFKFIIVPELGSVNGRLHFHGLIYCENVSKLDLKYLYTDKKFKTKKYRSNWFFNNFGANTFEKINNYSLGCVSYITKYITKEVLTLCNLYSCSYFCSRNLKTSKIIFTSEGLKQSLLTNFISYLNSFNLFKTYDFCDVCILNNSTYDSLLYDSYLGFDVV